MFDYVLSQNSKEHLKCNNKKVNQLKESEGYEQTHHQRRNMDGQ